MKSDVRGLGRAEGRVENKYRGRNIGKCFEVYGSRRWCRSRVRTGRRQTGVRTVAMLCVLNGLWVAEDEEEVEGLLCEDR